MKFNLSEWALQHRSFVIFCMIAATFGGVVSYFRLGRDEDPAFVIKTMVVQAAWPGASLNDTLQQVTERLERTLQETPGLDFVRSYTSAGRTTIFVNLKQETRAAKVPDIWYHVRKSIGDMRHTLPAGVVGPGFNDEFGDTYGIIYGFTADGFTHRELRDYVEDVRSRLLQVKDVSKIEVLGAQDEVIFVEFSTQQLAGLGIDQSALISALQAQNLVSPSGTIQTGNEKLLLRVSGAFNSEADVLAVNFVANGRLIRLRDIAQVHRGFADPPQPMFRVTESRPSARNCHAGGRRHSSRWPEYRTRHPRDQGESADRNRADARGRSALRGRPRHPRLHDIALAGDRHHHGGEFRQPRHSSRHRSCPLDPVDARLVFPIMEIAGIDLQRVSLGALIIALGLWSTMP